jgi:hypothetical protein
MDLKEIILRIKNNNTILIVQERNYIIIYLRLLYLIYVYSACEQL